MIGEAYVRVRPDLTGFRGETARGVTRDVRGVERQLASTNREFGRFSRGALVGTGALGGLGRAAAFASASFIGGAGLVYGIKTAVNAASNLDEQMSKTRVVFGQASQSVVDFSKDALLLARDQALETASSIGALLRPLGVIPQQAAATSITLTKLGVDLSSFYNTSVADALQAIKSGLVGEVEPLRRYGVVLSEARVQQAALAATGKTMASQLTNQEKVMARVTLILKDTAQAQGDAARTAGGFANQQRELQKNIRNTEILLGQTLIPRLTDVTKRVNAWLGETENQERLQRAVNEAIDDGAAVLDALTEALKTAKAVADPVVDTLGGLKNTVELLIAAMVARKVYAFATALTAVGPAGVAAAGGIAAASTALGAASAATTLTYVGAGAIGARAGLAVSATVAAGKVNVLRTALLRLAGIGIITVGIELAIKQPGSDWFSSHGLGFLNYSGSDLAKDINEARRAADAIGRATPTPLLQGVPGWPGQPSILDILTGNVPGSGPPGFSAREGGTGGGAVITSAQKAHAAAVTRDQATATELARAQAEGNRAQITAAAKARQEFVRDTIAFANQLIAEGRGDTAALEATLQAFYGEQASLQSIFDGYAQDDQDAADKRIQDAKERIQDAKDRAAEWRRKNHEFQETFAQLRRQVRLFHERFSEGVRQDAAEQQQRLEAQSAIQLQILENNLAVARLIPGTKKELAAEKTAQGVIVQWYKQRAKQLGLNTLAGQQAQGDYLAAKRAFLDLGKKEKKDAGGPWASREDFYAELQDEFAMYGSNIGPRGAPLSGQDSRASLAGVAKTHQTTVVQVFNYPVAASQALNDAKNAAKNLK